MTLLGAESGRLIPPEMLARSLDAKLDKSSGCWVWTGNRTTNGPDGYGRVFLGRHDGYLVHRVAYVQRFGPIPAGYSLDHLCRNRLCANPDHLEAVPHRVNVLRGESIYARNGRKTHCKRGHPFDERNTKRTATGGRACRACHSALTLAAYHARKAA